MCTVSWCRRADEARGYHLFFNRDEQRDREPATPPEMDTSAALPFVAARDGRAGGTWLAANAAGLTVGILNHYSASTADPDQPQSRGKLVISLADCADLDQFRQRLTALRPQHYRPFILFALDPTASVSQWCWDGEQLAEAEADALGFLTTSSFEPSRVCAARRAKRSALGSAAGASALRSMHYQHDPDDPAASIRMRREDAQTVSFVEIEFGSGGLCFRYRPEPPGGLELLPEVEQRLTLESLARAGLNGVGLPPDSSASEAEHFSPKAKRR